MPFPECVHAESLTFDMDSVQGARLGTVIAYLEFHHRGGPGQAVPPLGSPLSRQKRQTDESSAYAGLAIHRLKNGQKRYRRVVSAIGLWGADDSNMGLVSRRRPSTKGHLENAGT